MPAASAAGPIGTPAATAFRSRSRFSGVRAFGRPRGRCDGAAAGSRFGIVAVAALPGGETAGLGLVTAACSFRAGADWASEPDQEPADSELDSRSFGRPSPTSAGVRCRVRSPSRPPIRGARRCSSGASTAAGGGIARCYPGPSILAHCQTRPALEAGRVGGDIASRLPWERVNTIRRSGPASRARSPDRPLGSRPRRPGRLRRPAIINGAHGSPAVSHLVRTPVARRDGRPGTR
jgi:hypothetical protein